VIRVFTLFTFLSGLMNCVGSNGKDRPTPIDEIIQALRGVCASAMTEEESQPFEKQLRSHGLVAVDPLITLAKGPDPAGCRVIALFVLADLAREHASLTPRLVRELIPLAEDKDLQQLVPQILSGFGDTANEDLIAHLGTTQPDQRRAAFVALLWINKQRIVERPDLRDFDLGAPDTDWLMLADRWKAWWATAKKNASKPQP